VCVCASTLHGMLDWMDIHVLSVGGKYEGDNVVNLYTFYSSPFLSCLSPFTTAAAIAAMKLPSSCWFFFRYFLNYNFLILSYA